MEGRFRKLDGRDRRSGDERRSGTCRRGELRTVNGCHWHCTLWDLSRSGLCLVANGCFDLPLGSELHVALYEVVGLGSVFFTATLRWVANDELQTYLGVPFRMPPELPKDTFLERYFQANFED